MSRPTVNDIAREAGVSLATVDRVMNARPGVREKTARRVNEAIERLGYVRDVAAANLARRRAYRLAFVLPDSRTAFMTALRTAIEHAAAVAAHDRTRAEILTVPAFDSTAYARLLDGLPQEGFDGVALMAPETPQVRDAIRRLGEAGLAVVAFVSDQPQAARDRFVGIDNIAAGRTAGMLLGRFVRRADAIVLVVAGSMMSRDHMERRLGFDRVVLERFPGFRVLPSLEGRDDSESLARLLSAALDAQPRIDAVYSLGAGQRGLIETLRRRDPQRRLTVVAHELTPATRGALEDGTIDAVITQDVGHMARSALRVLRAKIDAMPIDPGQEQIRIEILLRENLPPPG
ncbi:LacI family transcriptional regulator [Salinarimonas ramus]|uniref:LacI family transcriptional regulator n=1 Tax=Salinarimonas ramus TaxID=690164 RepID=A0A917V260_9HYPH|nr:LacI family transcriptional regulator [Salinarimonas ramus]